jgi:hypothetical protein
VSNPEVNTSSNLIEAAMRRVDSASNAATPFQQGKTESDPVAAHRLRQITAFIGDDDPAAPIPNTAKALRHIFSHLGATAISPSQAGGYGARTVLLVALLSALGGGGFAFWISKRSGVDQALPQFTEVVPQAAPKTAPPVMPSSVEMAPTRPEQSAKISPEQAQQQVRTVVERWRQAWNDRNADAFLAVYSPQFVSSKGLARNDFDLDRRKNFASRSRISVGVKVLHVQPIDGDQMKVFFLQDYASGSYKETAQPKTLTLTRTGADWLITGEDQGPHPEFLGLSR